MTFAAKTGSRGACGLMLTESLPLARAMIRAALTAAIVLIPMAGTQQAEASTVQITPVKVQIDSPAAASKLTVSTSGQDPLTVQLRVFKWSRIAGEDRLIPTREVVASPPVVKLEPGKPYVVRIVRLAKAAIEGEETYRLLVDEIPDLRKQAPNFGTRFLVRQSIPVFFSNTGSRPKLEWNAAVKNGQLKVTARNLGERRLRVTELKVATAEADPVQIGTGLGYVLGRSAESWSAKVRAAKFPPGTPVVILAESDDGTIRTEVKIQRAP